MGIYIWLLFHNVVIHCVENAGCIQSSTNHLDYLIQIGTVELIFELAGMVRIFVKKTSITNQQGKRNMVITKKSHRKF
jgi:hypothetical protein